MRRICLSFEEALCLVRELSEHKRTRDPAAPRVAALPWRPFTVKPAPFRRQTELEMADLIRGARREDAFRLSMKGQDRRTPEFDPEMVKRAEDLHMTPIAYRDWQRKRADRGYLQRVDLGNSSR